MKIGIYDPYLDDLGGGEKYMMTIAEVLARQHDVRIFWDDKKDLEKVIERFSLNLSSVSCVSNIFDNKISFTQRFIESKKYDVIIILSDGSIPLLWSKKLYIHIQQPLKQLEHATLKDHLKLSRVTQFFCNSQYTKSFINKKFGLKTSVVYPPVEIKTHKVQKENIILHVGRFRVKNVGVGDYKKQSVMVEVFKSMIDSGLKDWKFVVATSIKDSDRDEFEKMKGLAKGYPIEFLVNMKNDDLWDIYSRSKIYWHASGFGEDLQLHPEYAEHFGISTVEAMGAGAVPIVINAGGQKEIVENDKNGYVWNTLEELSTLTQEVINDQKKYIRLSEQAKATAEKFSKSSFDKAVEQLIYS